MSFFYGRTRAEKRATFKRFIKEMCVKINHILRRAVINMLISIGWLDCDFADKREE